MLKPATRGITVWSVTCHVKACDAGYYGAECDVLNHVKACDAGYYGAECVVPC